MNEEQPDAARGTGFQSTVLPAMAGDGWVNCAQGHGHWGRFGAAGLLPVYREADGQAYVLLHQRAASTDQGGTWSVLGGARDSGESAVAAAIREAVEESDLDPARVRVEHLVRDDHGGWSYDTVIVSVDDRMSVNPIEGESLALVWVPVHEVPELNLHPGFAASWPLVRAAVDSILSGEPVTNETGVGASLPPGGAVLLPAHPITGARVVASEELVHGDGVMRRELATFDDGTQAVYERYARGQDATNKVLDAYVGRSVGARVPLSYPVGAREVYTDHMPGQLASARYQDLGDLANEGLAATRDGVFLGLHHALTATHGFTADGLVLGEGQSLIAIDDATALRGSLPDPDNPFVRTFFRQVEPHVFAWVDNPVPASDAEIMRRQLDSLRPVFESLGRADLHDAVMERFGQVAAHARGTDPLLPLPAGTRVTLSDPAAERHYPLPPPLGSQERIDHQRIGEALLTDDGRITETPQAKTIAIQALAERLRSPTPELVLASMGLSVGTDMAERLGDGRYVLIPHNERYPSMGADVLQVDELDPADPRHAPDKVLPMDDPRAETLVRMIAVSELMGSWSFGANNNVRVLALQQAAQEEFGLTDVLEWHMDAKTRSAVGLELDYNRDALRDFLRTQYEMTQEVLAASGITELISYRALSWAQGAEQPDWAVLNVGDTFESRQRPLASWSADRQIVADWLEQRGGNGVILVDRKPAQDILSLPSTGMGYLAQKEWVTLPGDSLITLDGVFSDNTPGVSAEQTAASSVSLGAPVLAAAVENPTEVRTPALHEASERWQPLAVTGELDPADPLDSQIIQVLEGAEVAPAWWPQDDSGYAITKRDLDFLGISPVQVKWLLTGDAPMGMTPELYRQFGTEMLQALERDGIDPSEVDIRLKGTGSGFFSGIHKVLPREDDLAGNPQAAQRLREWFGDDQDRPQRRPYDAMWRLGLEPEPSDFDLDINSTAIVRAAREFWRANNPDRYPGDFMGGHGYLDKKTALGTLPALAQWASKWEERLGRPLSLGVFESSGPLDATVLGRALSSHFQDTDWIIHRPDLPMAWRTPRSRFTDLLPVAGPAPDPISPQSGREETVADRQKTDSAGVGGPEPEEDFFARASSLLAQLRADLDSALTEESAEPNRQGDPLTVFAEALVQLGTEVDPPGTERPVPDLGLDGLAEVEQAVTTASRHAREFNGAKEWRQLDQIWQSTQQVWANAHEVLACYGGDLASDVRWHGMLRTVGTRAADTVADLSNRLGERLSNAGRHDSPGHLALQKLSRTSQEFAARLRGHDPTDRFAAFDTLAESIRDLRADFTRDPVPARDVSAAGQPRSQGFDAFSMVSEAFDGAGRHSREYNGAQEWRRLTSMWPAATRILGEYRANAVARYGADLATDVRWHGIERTTAVRSLDTVARLSNRLAERLSNAGRHGSPGYQAIQALGHAAQRAASALRGEDPAEQAERAAAFDRLGQSLRVLRADLTDIDLGEGPERGSDGPGGIPYGEPTLPALRNDGQGAQQQADHGNSPADRLPPGRTDSRVNGSGFDR